MNTGGDVSGVLSLLVWATLLPVVIVLVMRSRHRQEDRQNEEDFFRQDKDAADRSGTGAQPGPTADEAPKTDDTRHTP